MDGTVSFTVGFTLPQLSYQLKREGNRPWGLDGLETILFFMRPTLSATPTINGAAASIGDVASDTVVYPWSSGDVDTEGNYRGWFRILHPSQDPAESPEFDIFGLAHSPGRVVLMGAVARAARREIPIAWDFLANLVDYGNVELQAKVDLVKTITYGGPGPTVEQEDALDPRILDYLGKRAAVEIIPAAIDFWSNQVVTQTARETSMEISSYPDRIRTLERKALVLTAAANALLPTVQTLIGTPVGPLSDGPGVNMTGPLVTPGLEIFAHAPHGPQSPDPAVNARRHQMERERCF